MECQLRDYRTKPGELSEWIEEWLTRVYPLRVKMGFRIIAAWVVEEESRFLWILGWEGPPGSFEEADRAYYNSPERPPLSPDPARHLKKTEHSFITPVTIPSDRHVRTGQGQVGAQTSTSRPGGFSSHIFDATTREFGFAEKTCLAMCRFTGSAARLHPSAKHQQTPMKRNT